MRFAMSVCVLPLVLCSSSLGRESDDPLRVLFVGNSYTYVNDLPAMVEALSEEAGGRKVEVGRHLFGGCTLERHFKEKAAVDKIQSEPWDVVVLQEQSLRPILDREKMHKYARLLDKEIKQQNATTVFYLTWARQHIPAMQEGGDPSRLPDYARAMYDIGGAAKTTDFETWCRQHHDGLSGGLNGSYLDIAKELRADAAPVGMAWKLALDANPELSLHTKDKSHPNPVGTYLAACVFHATLLERNPVGLPCKLTNGDKVLANLPEDLAERLQAIAWQACQSLNVGRKAKAD